MNPIELEHLALVRRLVKPAVIVAHEMTPAKAALLHATLGLAGEVGELACPESPSNLLEEAGDFYFYCRDLRDILPIGNYDPHSVILPAGDVGVLAAAVGSVVDVVKKHTIYNQPFTDVMLGAVKTHLTIAEAYVEHELAFHNFSRADALRHNIDKLMARYPEGYTDGDAAARRDKQLQLF